MTIPCVDVITAPALIVSIRDLSDFKSGRHFAASLALVPRQNAIGGVEKMGGPNKRGDGYLRRLLIHGARSWTWLARFRDRRPANVAIVTLANKMVRVV